jgi:hypothetical protein
MEFVCLFVCLFVGVDREMCCVVLLLFEALVSSDDIGVLILLNKTEMDGAGYSYSYRYRYRKRSHCDTMSPLSSTKTLQLNPFKQQLLTPCFVIDAWNLT